MSDEAPYELDPVTLEVYDLFRRMPGDLLTPDAIASQIGYDVDEVEAALHELIELELVVEKDVSNRTYILSEGAPEL